MVGERDEQKVPDEGSSEEVDYEIEEGLGDAGVVKEKIRKISDELANAKKERQEFLDGWQRCKADTINLRKDAQQDIARAGGFASERLVRALVPALDSFDMAMGESSWQSADEAWQKGILNIRNQFIGALRSEGVTSFGSEGDEYDSAIHEILQEIRGEGDGKISRVVRRGWKFGDRVVRPAQVIVIRNESH